MPKGLIKSNTQERKEYEKFDTKSFGGVKKSQFKIKSAIKEKTYLPLNEMLLKSINIPDFKPSRQGLKVVDVLLGRVETTGRDT